MQPCFISHIFFWYWLFRIYFYCNCWLFRLYFYCNCWLFRIYFYWCLVWSDKSSFAFRSLRFFFFFMFFFVFFFAFRDKFIGATLPRIIPKKISWSQTRLDDPPQFWKKKTNCTIVRKRQIQCFFFYFLLTFHVQKHIYCQHPTLPR